MEDIQDIQGLSDINYKLSGKSILKFLKNRLPKEQQAFVNKFKNNNDTFEFLGSGLEFDSESIIYRFLFILNGKEYKVETFISDFYPFKVPSKYTVTIGQSEINLCNVYYDESYFPVELQRYYEEKTRDIINARTKLCSDNWNVTYSLFVPFEEFLDAKDKIYENRKLWLDFLEKLKLCEDVSNCIIEFLGPHDI